mmetsp:Transcript_28971/g.26324  ORF Transcript_28971/g.26324 Transcript_28971/m.26324 type:complete len:83 (-) Transcript_28971:1126-1374(-)
MVDGNAPESVDTILDAIERNFGGADSAARMKNIVGNEITEFKKKIGVEYRPMDSIVRNLHDNNSRYLMLISQGAFGTYILDH